MVFLFKRPEKALFPRARLADSISLQSPACAFSISSDHTLNVAVEGNPARPSPVEPSPREGLAHAGLSHCTDGRDMLSAPIAAAAGARKRRNGATSVEWKRQRVDVFKV